MRTKEVKTALRGMGRIFAAAIMPSKTVSMYRCHCGGLCGVSSRFYTSLDKECGLCDKELDYSDIADKDVQRYLGKKELREY